MSSPPPGTRPVFLLPLVDSALVLVGTTASGKSQLAMEFARHVGNVELVSVDSMQVYRGMDIGTAKPTVEERTEIPHHMIDLVDPWQEFSVAEFQRSARRAIGEITARGNQPVLVGGTGLYLRSIVDDLEIPARYPDVRVELEANPDTAAQYRRLTELDPVAASRIEPDNRRRILRALEVTVGSGRPFSSYGPGLEKYPATPFRMMGIRMPKEVADHRIEQRYERQMAAGFIDEVKELLDSGRELSRTARQALGYRELLSHLQDGVPLADALQEAIRRTKSFAHRQRMWFRRDPRITWLDCCDDPLTLLPDLLKNAGHD